MTRKSKARVEAELRELNTSRIFAWILLIIGLFLALVIVGLVLIVIAIIWLLCNGSKRKELKDEL